MLSNQFRFESNAAVPSSRYDGVSVLAHEIGHGLGFISRNESFPGTLNSFDIHVTTTANGSF